MNLLDGREAMMDCILLEHIPSSNDEDRLHVILEAMEQNRRISFKYTKYYNNSEHKPKPHVRITSAPCLSTTAKKRDNTRITVSSPTSYGLPTTSTKPCCTMGRIWKCSRQPRSGKP